MTSDRAIGLIRGFIEAVEMYGNGDPDLARLKAEASSFLNASRQESMVGRYVIVRCKDAGVHAGVLRWHKGRECLLEHSRRLWYWRAAKGAFLSGVAAHGLHESSKIGEPVRCILTENCEIIECSPESAKSIAEAPSHEPE